MNNSTWEYFVWLLKTGCCLIEVTANTGLTVIIYNVVFHARGLLLPHVVVDDHGGQRSDPGMLGAGIYFASAARLVSKILKINHS